MIKKLIELIKRIYKREIKPVVFYLPENSSDMFVDVEYLQEGIKSGSLNAAYYGGLALGFGKNVFIFDVNSCEFYTWVRYVGGEPKMEICDIKEIK